MQKKQKNNKLITKIWTKQLKNNKLLDDLSYTILMTINNDMLNIFGLFDESDKTPQIIKNKILDDYIIKLTNQLELIDYYIKNPLSLTNSTSDKLELLTLILLDLSRYLSFYNKKGNGYMDIDLLRTQKKAFK